MNIYELKNVKKYYGDILALDVPSLTFDEGTFYIVYGPNAAGKTTLLNLLAFLDEPSEGEVLFQGDVLQGGGNYRISDVTLLMQNPYLFKSTVLDNVCRGLAFRGMKKNRMYETAKPVMEKLGIWNLRRRDVWELSGGQQRKVAIARALVLDTQVLLLDEPTAHLDGIHVDVIEEMISEITGDGGKTVVMTTHDIGQAHRLTDNIIYLMDGRITRTPLWNNFRVTLIGVDGVKTAELAPGAQVYVATDGTGTASIAIDPKDIIVSRERVRSSALNCLKGRIVGLSEVNGLVDVVIDAGVTLHAFITHRSLREMHLGVGQEIFLTFKASAVEVF